MPPKICQDGHLIVLLTSMPLFFLLVPFGASIFRVLHFITRAKYANHTRLSNRHKNRLNST
jgi:hypothetical protein